MSRETIHLHGHDVKVREDTAKAYRGVNWALISIAAFILIAAALFIGFLFSAAGDGEVSPPVDDARPVAR